MKKCIDSHAHLTIISKDEKEIDSVINRAKQNGVDYIVDIGVHPSDIDNRVKILSKYKNVYLTAGFYPDYADEITEEDINNFYLKIKKINSNKKIIKAVGEIGLDYFHHSDNKENQINFFRALMLVAKEIKLPVIIHSRDSFEDTLDVLKNAPHDEKGIFHCFSGDKDVLKKALDLGYIVSFAGNVSYLKSDSLRESAKYVPNDLFTIETDSPYLTPQKFRGRRNEPYFVVYIADVIAEAKGLERDDILKYSFKNTKRVLNI